MNWHQPNWGGLMPTPIRLGQQKNKQCDGSHELHKLLFRNGDLDRQLNHGVSSKTRWRARQQLNDCGDLYRALPGAIPPPSALGSSSRTISVISENQAFALIPSTQSPGALHTKQTQTLLQPPFSRLAISDKPGSQPDSQEHTPWVTHQWRVAGRASLRVKG